MLKLQGSVKKEKKLAVVAHKYGMIPLRSSIEMDLLQGKYYVLSIIICTHKIWVISKK